MSRYTRQVGSDRFTADSDLQERNFSRRAGVIRPKIVRFIPDSGLKVSGLSRHTCTKKWLECNWINEFNRWVNRVNWAGEIKHTWCIRHAVPRHLRLWPKKEYINRIKVSNITFISFERLFIAIHCAQDQPWFRGCILLAGMLSLHRSATMNFIFNQIARLVNCLLPSYPLVASNAKVMKERIPELYAAYYQVRFLFSGGMASKNTQPLQFLGVFYQKIPTNSVSFFKINLFIFWILWSWKYIFW